MCPGFAATPGLVRIVVPEGLNNRGVFALISKNELHVFVVEPVKSETASNHVLLPESVVACPCPPIFLEYRPIPTAR